ncbi:hypothetical protein AB0M12_43105 [Nocardia vinacea]|uniref:hypothetical protein n=1 Tax=Nocardia vinacea TaxID=96468 RepID=UPI00343AFE6B
MTFIQAGTSGTRQIDFDAPTDQITFHAADLELPLQAADPVLADILYRYAALAPPPRRLDATWSSQENHGKRYRWTTPPQKRKSAAQNQFP